MNEVLVVRNLNKGFGKNINEDVILKDVSFELYEGETLAIIGKNGAGKSVMLNCIFNIMDKTSGDVYLELGHDSFEENMNEVGFQFQEQPFTQSITLKKLIKEYKILYADRIDEEMYLEMLEVFSLKDLLNKKTDILSGGQKQRVNLFLAMLTNPKLMILDEFITGLDINSVDDILEYISKHKKKTNVSMIIVSHQPDEIEKLADRIIVLKDGNIIQQTTPKDVLSEYPTMKDFLKEAI